MRKGADLVQDSSQRWISVRDDANTRSSAVLAKLRELGLAKADVNAPDVGVHPQYDYRKGQRLTGHRVVRPMTARVRDLERLGVVLDGLRDRVS